MRASVCFINEMRSMLNSMLSMLQPFVLKISNHRRRSRIAAPTQQELWENYGNVHISRSSSDDERRQLASASAALYYARNSET